MIFYSKLKHISGLHILITYEIAIKSNRKNYVSILINTYRFFVWCQFFFLYNIFKLVIYTHNIILTWAIGQSKCSGRQLTIRVSPSLYNGIFLCVNMPTCTKMSTLDYNFRKKMLVPTRQPRNQK